MTQTQMQVQTTELSFTVLDSKLGKEVINLGALPQPLQKEVQRSYEEVGEVLQKFGHAGLKVGEVLRKVREKLKPRGIWVAFLNRLPGMSPRTADRFIVRFERAKELLPENVIRVASATGVDLSGVEEGKPYGKFTNAVKKLGPPPKDADVPVAMDWVNRVVLEQRKEIGEKRIVKVNPVEKAARVLADAAIRHSEESEGQIQFVRDVLESALRKLKYSEVLTVQALKVKGGGRRLRAA